MMVAVVVILVMVVMTRMVVIIGQVMVMVIAIAVAIASFFNLPDPEATQDRHRRHPIPLLHQLLLPHLHQRHPQILPLTEETDGEVEVNRRQFERNLAWMEVEEYKIG